MSRFDRSLWSLFLLYFLCLLATDAAAQTLSAVASPEKTLQEVRRLMSVDQVKKAEKLLQVAVRDFPDDGRLKFTLARIMEYDGRHEEAIQFLLTSITDKTDRVTRRNFLVFIGRTSQQLAEDGPTIKRRRGSFTASPEKPGTDKAAFTKKHLKVAEAAFRELVEIDPRNSQFVEFLATTLTLAGKSHAAIELWLKRLKQDPGNRTATLQLAALRFKIEQPDVATTLLKDALK